MPPLPEVGRITRDLVRIPSESSDPVATGPAPESGVTAHIEDLCRRTGLACRRMEVLPNRHNLLIELPRPGAPRLLIVAHMDTVSAGGMNEPFAGTVRDNLIHGRGACDDKGPLAAGLAALISLKRAGTAPVFDLTLATTVDEECTMSGAARLAEEPAGWDLCLALEPTRLKIIRAHKGVHRFLVSTTGRAAHSSSPEKGENAILTMLPVLDDLLDYGQSLAEEHEPDLGRASLAITRISGGSTLNMIPDSCELGVDIRLLSGMDPEDIKQQVREIVGGRAEVREVFSGAGIATEMANPLIARFMAAISTAGVDPGPVTAAFATDCSRLKHRGPCLVWGPGDIAVAHQKDEHISLKELEQAVAILVDFLGRC